MKDNSTKLYEDSAYLGGTKWFRAKDVRHLNSHALLSHVPFPRRACTRVKRARLLSCRALLRTTQQGFGLSQPRDVFSPLVDTLATSLPTFLARGVAESRPFLRYRPHEPALINYISRAMLERKYRALCLFATVAPRRLFAQETYTYRMFTYCIVWHVHYLLETLPHNVSNYYCHRGYV